MLVFPSCQIEELKITDMKSHDLIVGEPGLEPGISNTKNLRVYLKFKL